MHLYTKIALCAFIILSFVPFGSLTIKCWDCRSSNDPRCADPFDNATIAIADCNIVRELSHLPATARSMCRKIRQKVNGDWHIIRDCAFLGEEDTQGDERLKEDGKFCVMKTGDDNILTEYCTCIDKDWCNSSSMFGPVPLLLAALPSFVFKVFV